ncbi:unnamed protein product [Discosporangium mesarthrocarpum]
MRGIGAFLSIAREEVEVAHLGYQVLVSKTTPQHYCYPHNEDYEVPVVFAVNEAFVKDLAVALHSLVDACTRPHHLKFMIVDIGVEIESRGKISDMLGPVRVKWVDFPGYGDDFFRVRRTGRQAGPRRSPPHLCGPGTVLGRGYSCARRHV